MLVDGQWVEKWQPVQSKDEQGGFVRQVSSFRNWVTPDGSPGPTGQGGFAAEPGRYHLYVGLICPWASRTLIARKLKKLEDIISVSVVQPKLTDQGWKFGEDFPGSTLDTVNNATWMHEIYTLADSHFTGRATIPVLWDKTRKTIVNNESSDILRILNSGFGIFASDEYDLFPEPLRDEIEALNADIYPKLNNGVYKAGFATTQIAYEQAYADVFGMLESLEERLGSRPKGFLVGTALTEADIRLFVTLIRFDAAYNGVFKCNKKKLLEYPELSAYVERMLHVPGVASTVNVDHIKHGYYSIETLNPNGIVPAGPELPWQKYLTL